ncbi:hypothetical protein A2V49_02265 [candidate division WWE3 bacterium RBG_19FT_COMBO_34_6]|uniref:Ferredoxin n=1 Tax=candidate division WWE3 bacterium RBG_19FT_COMBO_34_6 TaxID=1802612 RepID=A0A1F4UJK9_UNCKA|nr:MAG: hypothetical protein A2V49_02265 [candidate division WWE3 bacterium RBG_19FT_COMBO_34_6]
MKKYGQDTFTDNKNQKIKIKIITEKCISAAVCLIQAPGTFDLDDNQIAYVKEGTWDELKNIFKAAKACPTNAIIIEDLNGNTLWPK